MTSDKELTVAVQIIEELYRNALYTSSIELINTAKAFLLKHQDRRQPGREPTLQDPVCPWDLPLDGLDAIICPKHGRSIGDCPIPGSSARER